ncbi:hypothetical protein BSLG_006055 [Batrachochytrium salamandrivorans]|nr:hypothetical protein BSLG_006055 [Batrachochytrium salamandrivorans]
MNLVLSECRKFRKDPPKNKVSAGTRGETFTDLVILRGETIISLSVEAPPPTARSKEIICCSSRPPISNMPPGMMSMPPMGMSGPPPPMSFGRVCLRCLHKDLDLQMPMPPPGFRPPMPGAPPG